VNVTMKLLVPSKAVDFLISWATRCVSFPSTLLYRVSSVITEQFAGPFSKVGSFSANQENLRFFKQAEDWLPCSQVPAIEPCLQLVQFSPCPLSIKIIFNIILPFTS
jgi:hypothetical protein